MSEVELTGLKVVYNNDVHRLRVNLSTFTYEDLVRAFCQTFDISSDTFIIQYEDNEGDQLSICSSEEYKEACYVLLNENEGKCLKFKAISHDQLMQQQSLAEPIIQSIEHLVQTLTTTMEKMQLQATQMSSIPTNSSINNKNNVPFEQVSHGLRYAAEGLSSFASDFVGGLRKKSTSNDSIPSAPIDTSVPASVNSSISNESPSKRSVTFAFSEDEVKWAEELSIITGIFPNVENHRIIALLEQTKGDVNAVINTLMG